MARYCTLLLALLLAVPALPGAAGVALARQCNAADNPHCADVQRLAEDARVRQALDAIARNRERARADLIELTQIEAPPFGEAARARRYAELLREAGADSVWLDEVGNAIGLLRGTRRDRTVVIEGHLDTVFPEGTDVTVQVRGDTLLAPGIADDTRGLVAVLHVLHGVTAGALRPEADVLFIGTVGEEGLGDLRGVKHLFRDGGPRIDTYIAVEPGEAYLTVGGIGSHRYRVTFRGPGGHSWGAFGTSNPIHALGRAIRIFDDRADAVTRDGPRTSYNVGRIGGGTSVNSVAFEAWLEVDMRSEDDASLRALDEIFQASVQQALTEQNRLLRRGDALTVDVEMVGRRPSGTVDRASQLVRRGEAVIRHFGGEPAYRSGSTNSNVPFSLGVPAVTIGAGGQSGDAHALTEWWADTDGRAHVSVQQALLLLLLEAGLASAPAALPPADPAEPLFHTFSIAAVDPATGETGVAVTTRVACVGNAVPWVRAGVGAVATQAFTRMAYGTELLDLLERGVAPADALRQLVAADDGRDRRQVGVIAADGSSAQFTGPEANAWAGERAGPDFVAQGNLLVGPEVLDAVARSFAATRASGRALADRLVDALAAGQAAGGDARVGRLQSAALLVADPRPGVATRDDRVSVNLNICEHAQPVAELRRQFDAVSGTLGFRTLEQHTGSDVAQLKIMLHALGYYRPDEAALARSADFQRYTPDAVAAVDRFRADHNLTTPSAGTPPGWVDRALVDALWAALETEGKAAEVRRAVRELTAIRR